MPVIDQLRAVNEAANERIAYEDDGRQIKWADILPGQHGLADCTGFARTKAQDLANEGFDPDQIWIAECAVPPSKIVNHAIVRVHTEDGDYFLTNGLDDPLTLRELEVMGWSLFEEFKHGTRATVMETLGG